MMCIVLQLKRIAIIVRKYSQSFSARQTPTRSVVDKAGNPTSEYPGKLALYLVADACTAMRSIRWPGPIRKVQPSNKLS